MFLIILQLALFIQASAQLEGGQADFSQQVDEVNLDDSPLGASPATTMIPTTKTPEPTETLATTIEITTPTTETPKTGDAQAPEPTEAPKSGVVQAPEAPKLDDFLHPEIKEDVTSVVVSPDDGSTQESQDDGVQEDLNSDQTEVLSGENTELEVDQEQGPEEESENADALEPTLDDQEDGKDESVLQDNSSIPSEDQVTEDQVQEDQVTKDQVTEDQVQEDQVTEDQVTEDQVQEDQVPDLSSSDVVDAEDDSTGSEENGFSGYVTDDDAEEKYDSEIVEPDSTDDLASDEEVQAESDDISENHEDDYTIVANIDETEAADDDDSESNENEDGDYLVMNPITGEVETESDIAEESNDEQQDSEPIVVQEEEDSDYYPDPEADVTEEPYIEEEDEDEDYYPESASQEYFSQTEPIPSDSYVTEANAINEYKVDVPGAIAQGDFYEYEYEEYMEKTGSDDEDDMFASWRSITYFLVGVIGAASAYLIFSNRRRLCRRSARRNYAYSRLGEQGNQPLV